MTHKLLDHETHKVIYRSAVRPQKSSAPNYRLAPHGVEVSTSFSLLNPKFHLDLLIPNRNSPNGYSTVMPAELQSVTLSH